MMVTPPARRRRTSAHMSRRSSTSTPAVGSSRNRISGSCASALAISTRRFMPPESVMIRSWRLSQSERSRSTFSRCAGFGARPKRPRLKHTVAQTVSNVSVVSSCGTRPIFERGRAVVAHDVVAVGEHRAARRRHDPADDADQRGLAGAVGAEQGEDLALADLEVDVLQRLQAGGVGLGQPGDGDDGRHRCESRVVIRARRRSSRPCRNRRRAGP